MSKETVTHAMTLADTYARKRSRWAAHPFTTEEAENEAEKQMDAARAALESYLSEHLAGVPVAPRINPACGVHGPIPCEGARCICASSVREVSGG
jgi:hypothetical protein